MVKPRTAKDLAGMTVNERLYETNQLDEFDAAVAARDEVRLREVLERLHLGESNVVEIIRSQLGQPCS